MTDKPDPAPREVKDTAQLTSYAFFTNTYTGAETLELHLLTPAGDKRMVVIPWSSARHAPRGDVTSVWFIRTETESEANHRAHVELSIAMGTAMLGIPGDDAP